MSLVISCENLNLIITATTVNFSNYFKNSFSLLVAELSLRAFSSKVSPCSLFLSTFAWISAHSALWETDRQKLCERKKRGADGDAKSENADKGSPFDGIGTALY